MQNKSWVGVLTVLILSLPLACFGQEHKSSVFKQSNEIIKDIYQEITKIKDKYPKLSRFDQTSLKNVHYYSVLRLGSSRLIDNEQGVFIKYGEPYKQDKYNKDDNAIYIEVYFTNHPFTEESKQIRDVKDFIPAEIYVGKLRIFLEYYIITDSELRNELISIIEKAVK